MRRRGRQDPGAAGRAVRHRPAPRAVGRLGRSRPSRRRWPSATSSSARSSRSARTSTDVPVGDRVSGEGHIVCGNCRNCRAGRRHLCISTVGRRRQPRRRLRRLRRHPRDQRLGAARRPRPRPRGASSTRSATRRTPRCSGRWSARTCSSPAPGRSGSWRRRSRGTPGARHVVRHRRLATTGWRSPRQAGADLVDQRLARRARRRPGASSACGGLRHRARDVRAPRRRSRT